MQVLRVEASLGGRCGFSLAGKAWREVLCWNARHWNFCSDEEIEAIQRRLAKKAPFTNYPFLSVGQKVRIRGGSLDGVQGILTPASNDRSLVVSVECIERSIAIRIDGYGVEAA